MIEVTSYTALPARLSFYVFLRCTLLIPKSLLGHLWGGGHTITQGFRPISPPHLHAENLPQTHDALLFALTGQRNTITSAKTQQIDSAINVARFFFFFFWATIIQRNYNTKNKQGAGGVGAIATVTGQSTTSPLWSTVRHHEDTSILVRRSFITCVPKLHQNQPK